MTETGRPLSERIPFFTWEWHRRSEGLARELGFELVVLTSPKGRALRYLELVPRTILALAKRRARWIVVQCPSIVLTSLAIMWAAARRMNVAVDAHNEAVTPFVNDTSTIRRLTKWIHRSASLVIVTNRALAEIVEANGGRAFILPDALPVPPTADSRSESVSTVPTVTAICTYAPDEPVDAILAAARLVRRPVRLVLTGDPSRRGAALPPLPGNVHLSGYLPDDEYWALLRRSHAVVDLTTMPSCLVCGAYEALSAGVPLVLTDDPAAIEVFSSAAIFVRNEAESIARGIDAAVAEQPDRRRAATERNRFYRHWWTAQAGKLVELLRTGPST